MKKHIIAIMLSLAMASSSVGAVPALAVETTAEEDVAEQEEISNEQKEISEVTEDSDSGLDDEEVLNEEIAQTEEEPAQEETVGEADSYDEQKEISDTADTTEMAEEDEEEVTESEDGDEVSAEVTETVEPLMIEEEAVTSEENEAGLAGDVVDSGKCGPYATWTLTGSDDNLTLTISGSGDMYYYSEPDNPWATKRSKIKTVIVEDGITSIGREAFCYLSKLTKVALSDTVTNIEEWVFKGCSSLTSVEIPDSVTSIGYGVFAECSSLTSVTLPNSVTNIGGAFMDCTSLTSITLPNGVTDISDAFEYCTSLTSVTLPNSVTNISDAFEGCSSLISITIPDSVSIIGDDAFLYCSSLTSIEIPDSVMIIGSCAFEGCTSLTRIEIPDSVTSISDYAFYACSNITSITIPDSVMRIGKYAFGVLKSETNATIRFRGTKEQWDAAVGNNDVPFKAVIYNCFSVPADFTLSDTSFVYTGEAIKPTVTVSYKGEKLVEGVGYKLEYKDNINPGTATVNVIGIGKYSGTEPFKYTILPGKTTRGDLFNLAKYIKVTWKAVPGAKYYKVYREGVTDPGESLDKPIIVTTDLVGWDRQYYKLTNGHTYRYKIVASLTGKGDSSGDSPLSYSKVIYRLQTVAIIYAKNISPGKVTVKHNVTDSGDSYVLRYCERQDMVGAKAKVVMGADNIFYTIGGLKKGKTYYISIRVRKKVNGVYYYTTFGVPKKVTITK